MILRIDHIGLAAANAEDAGKLLRALNFDRVAGGVAAEYQVNCDFWRLGGDVDVEVVTPAGANSAVDGVLAQTGPGLYHLALEVDDLEADVARLAALGAVQLEQTPCAGAKAGMCVTFVYIGAPLNLLVELVQYSE